MAYQRRLGISVDSMSFADHEQKNLHTRADRECCHLTAARKRANYPHADNGRPRHMADAVRGSTKRSPRSHRARCLHDLVAQSAHAAARGACAATIKISSYLYAAQEVRTVPIKSARYPY